MAKSSGSGSQLFALLVLLGILIAGGAWNYHRNLELENAELRPYRSYSLEDLEALRAAFQAEADAHSARFRAAASRNVKVRGGGMLDDQVDEFERVQHISAGKREIAGEYAKNQVQLDAVESEIATRAEEGEGWHRELRRLTKYP
jgi:hypothetical protein